MLSIIIKSICYYLIVVGILGVLGLTVPIFYSILILVGFIGVGLNSNESYTAIYFNTEEDEE